MQKSYNSRSSPVIYDLTKFTLVHQGADDFEVIRFFLLNPWAKMNLFNQMPMISSIELYVQPFLASAFGMKKLVLGDLSHYFAADLARQPFVAWKEYSTPSTTCVARMRRFGLPLTPILRCLPSFVLDPSCARWDRISLASSRFISVSY